MLSSLALYLCQCFKTVQTFHWLKSILAVHDNTHKCLQAFMSGKLSIHSWGKAGRFPLLASISYSLARSWELGDL